MKPISDMTVDELRAELEQTRAALANMALLLEEAEASGKAARRLAKEDCAPARRLVQPGPEG